MIDLNHAKTQADFDVVPETRHDVNQLKARLQDRMESVLSYLLPAGKVRSGKFYIGDVQGHPGDSMVVELTGPKAGMWFDHATSQGSDIIKLWAAVRHLDTRHDFPKILDEIASWLGEAPPATRSKPDRKSPPMDELGPHTATWDYHDRDGSLLFRVYRYDPPTGKQFRPWDVRAGRWQAPSPRPLYNLPEILKSNSVVFSHSWDRATSGKSRR